MNEKRLKPEQTITLRRIELDMAVEEGIITQSQASALWESWHHAQYDPPESTANNPSPKFGFVTVLYYFGGMLAIGAMSLFMTLSWQSFGSTGLLVISSAYLVASLKVADNLDVRGYVIPAGIMATLAVVLVPLIVWCAQHALGLWPPGGIERYSAYHTQINWRWLTLELSTLIAGIVMLWRYRHPFMVMPIAVTLWYMSMDIAHALMQSNSPSLDWKLMRDVSLAFGIATLFVALWVDIRCRRAKDIAWRKDFAFWLYLFGTLMFWGGLSMRDSDSELGKFVYCLINLSLVFIGAALGRRVFTVFGALGIAGYLGYLSHRVFGGSLLFPFVLTLLGLGVIALGVWWQRNEARLQVRINHWVPKELRGPIPY